MTSRERTRGHRRHGHRGAERPRQRPQRPVAVRSPARARRRSRLHPDRRRPPARTCATRCAFMAGRGLRPRDHERRPRAHGRRPHGRGRRALPGPRDGARRGARADASRRSSSRSPSAGRTSTCSAIEAGTRKQATIPDGATVLEPVGTAPGLVVPPREGADGAPARGRRSSCCPGPPRELQPMWQQAVATDALKAALGGATTYEQRTLRLFGMPESEIAETLARGRARGRSSSSASRSRRA